MLLAPSLIVVVGNAFAVHSYAGGGGQIVPRSFIRPAVDRAPN